MQERERTVVGSLVVLLLVLWLGFLWHRSPHFAGSAWGGVLGVSGGALMLWPIGYSLIKRVPAMKAAVTRRVPLRTLLAWHVYTGVLGALLALLHTGHKFQSPLGVALTATMFGAVLSGYVGRHLLGLLSHELRDRQEILARLRESYQRTAEELARHPAPPAAAAAVPSWAASRGFFRRAVEGIFFDQREQPDPEDGALRLSALRSRALRLAEAIADLEYAVASDELLKRRLSRWLTVHIAVSVAFYGLLALHVGAALYYGLRWGQP